MTYNERKATALAVMLIEKGGEEKAPGSEKPRLAMPYLKLIKLMYLCDRQMYKVVQEFITNDDFISMKYGPVLSNTLKLIREDDQNKNGQNQNNQKNVSFWKKHIETIGDDVQVISNEDVEGLLGDTEKETAEFYATLFIEVDEWRTVELTHKLCPEWDDPTGKGLGVWPIEIKDITKAIQMEEAMQFS